LIKIDSLIHLQIINFAKQMELIEWVGVITGIIAVYLLYKNHILTWPVGFINIGCFMFIFWQQRLYGDFAVQVIFLLTGIAGWANWNRKIFKNPTTLSSIEKLIWITVTLALLPLTSYYLNHYTNCSYPIAEAAILSLSIIGQCLTALRKLENWYWWLVADALMMVIYYKKELYPTSVYAGIIFIIGIFGLISWQKTILNSTKN
jgi:nicotinamide mononucleotide transporter